MCNFNSSILLISVFNIHTGTRFNKIKGVYRIGPHNKVNSSLKLSTNSFTYTECITLVNILYKNFNLKASVQSAGCYNQYIIYI